MSITRENLRDQDPDLDEDFGRTEWPFIDEGALDDIPVPAGDACVKISNILSNTSENSGDFSFSGQAEQMPPEPGLFVDEVGPIPIPLWDEQARSLIDKAEKSSFGHNMDTKLDENVRKRAGIKKMAVMIGDRLGYKDIPLQCILYKLLVYEKGGHFVKHQDTEKEEGMILTLVIQSPSLHEGGDLVVYGGGEIKHRHDFGKADGTATYLPHYAVHYADASKTVTKGYLLALVYSVCLPPTMRQLERNPNMPMAGELVDPMRSMEERDSFALLLSHEYTNSSIMSFGIDRARFCALEKANAALPDREKLGFVIATLYHHVRFYIHYGSSDWDEEDRDEEITCYPTKGLKIMDVEKAFAALQSTATLDSSTFCKFMEVASVKVTQVAEVMAKRPREESRNNKNNLRRVT
ncbi:hypothetical protein P3T76_003058 [Phytophthora citrophthora]|uniref:Fe2OG dioxygenase domain-containing protein n=1 Tax=Phytophthora citrophthora TaxID=4793 RepID=A0AAD9LQJ4_9STRA|nr:hypothetical protein P3T76_003058 [Phytophthora citrophthora]